jgi:hypothetical protein
VNEVIDLVGLGVLLPTLAASGKNVSSGPSQFAQQAEFGSLLGQLMLAVLAVLAFTGEYLPHLTAVTWFSGISLCGSSSAAGRNLSWLEEAGRRSGGPPSLARAGRTAGPRERRPGQGRRAGAGDGRGGRAAWSRAGAGRRASATGRGHGRCTTDTRLDK